MINRRISITLLVLSIGLILNDLLPRNCYAEEPKKIEEPQKLQAGDTIAMLGDSITAMRGYTVLVHTYLVACQPVPNLRVMQFGFGGAYISDGHGLLAHAAFHKPTVVTSCYGMNDVGHHYTEETYKKSSQNLVQAIKKVVGVRMILLGSPGCVDSDTIKTGPYKKGPGGNNTPENVEARFQSELKLYRDANQKAAKEENVIFADIYNAMFDAMNKAKAKKGKEYHIAPDGIHPYNNGALVMAYAFLKSLGCDGNIGSLTMDISAEDKATATGGHKIISAKRNEIEVESNRYPFCVFDEPKSPGTAGIVEFFPFNEDLNRFILIVKGAKVSRLKVTWGLNSREFDTSSLEKGINLAAEFPENPFCENFKKVLQAVRLSQSFHQEIDDKGYHKMSARINKETSAELAAHYLALESAALKREQEVQDAATAMVVPIRHTIKVEPANIK